MSKRHTKSENSSVKSVEYFNYFGKPLARINLGSGFLVTLSGHTGRDESGNLVPLNDDGTQRIRQAYQNLKTTIESTGASLQNVIKLYSIASAPVYRNIINRIQSEFYDSSPPRTLIFANLPDDDIFEISADIYISNDEIKELKKKIKEAKTIKAQDKHNRHKHPEPEYSEDSVNTVDDYDDNTDEEYEEKSECDCEHSDEDTPHTPQSPQTPRTKHKFKENKHVSQKHRHKEEHSPQIVRRTESTRNRQKLQETIVEAIPVKTKHSKRS